MWQLLTSLRKRDDARGTRARHSWWYRPRCNLLEDRCLLSVTLTNNAPPGSLVGAPVVWTATASDLGNKPVYQFSVGPTGGALQVVRDFSTTNTFTWNPMQESSFTIQVISKRAYNDAVAKGESTSTTYTSMSRVTGTSAVISPMANPLVALFSAPLSRPIDVCPVRPGGPLALLAEYLPAAHRPRREYQFHRGWHAAPDDVPHEVCPG